MGDFVFTNAPPYTWGGELVVELDTREMEQKMLVVQLVLLVALQE